MQRVISGTRLTPVLAAATAALLVVISGCTSQAICEKHKECASDPPGEDFVRICQTRWQGEIDALRANKESECHDVATAKEALDACRAQLDCDDYEQGDLGGECDDELDDYEDAIDDAADGDYGGRVVYGGGNGPYMDRIPRDCSTWD